MGEEIPFGDYDETQKIADDHNISMREAHRVLKARREFARRKPEILARKAAERERGEAMIWSEDAFSILRDLIAGADDHRAWHIPDEIAGRARAFVAKETAQREFRAQCDARLEREQADFARLPLPPEPGQCGDVYHDFISLTDCVCVMEDGHEGSHTSRPVSGGPFTWGGR